MQRNGRATPEPTLYAALLAATASDLDALVAAVARDVAAPDESLAPVKAEVRPALVRLIELLDAGAEPTRLAVADLRREGADAAAAGTPVERVIDRYLSSGWVLWADATRRSRDPSVLAALGAALLRTGDLAAAEIAAGHGAMTRTTAGRAATARAELLAALLALPPGDTTARARVERAATELGLDPTSPQRVVVVAGGAAIPVADQVASALALRAPRSGRSRTGDLLGVVPLAGRVGDRLVLAVAAVIEDGIVARALNDVASGPWFAGAATSASLVEIAAARAAAADALRVALRLDRAGQVVDASDVLLERALVSDEHLLTAAVDSEIGRLRNAPRGGPLLLDTLETWLRQRQNVRAAARSLGVAPRTIAYRLDRIERILGRPLDGDTVLRLAAALFASRLA